MLAERIILELLDVSSGQLSNAPTMSTEQTPLEAQRSPRITDRIYSKAVQRPDVPTDDAKRSALHITQ